MEVEGIPMIKVPLQTPCCNRVVASVFTDEPEKTVTRTCPNLWCGATIHHRRTYRVTITRSSGSTHRVVWKERVKMKSKAMEWFYSQDIEPYKNKWVAIRDEEIVADGEKLSSVSKKAREIYPDEVPFVIYVPPV